MSVSELVFLMRGGIVQIFMLIMPCLAVALVVGLIVAIFQAVTSIQEQTLTFRPKFIAILVVIALLSGWMFTRLEEYTVQLFSMIPGLAL